MARLWDKGLPLDERILMEVCALERKAAHELLRTAGGRLKTAKCRRAARARPRWLVASGLLSKVGSPWVGDGGVREDVDQGRSI